MTETKLERKTLRDWRKEAGLTQEELEELVGLARSHVADIETGRRPLRSASGHKIARALGLKMSQIQPVEYVDDIDPADWIDDGFALSAPRQTLKWWRERRGLSQQELSHLAGMGHAWVSSVENGLVTQVHPRSRRKISRALQVAPNKLLLPGDKAQPSEAQSREARLDASLRRAVRIMRRWQDVARDGRYLTRRAEEDLQDLIRDTALEIEGT